MKAELAYACCSGFLLTPLYLLWLLVAEVINGISFLKPAQWLSSLPSTHPIPSLNVLLGQQQTREEENFRAAIASVAEQSSFLSLPLQEHVQSEQEMRYIIDS